MFIMLKLSVQEAIDAYIRLYEVAFKPKSEPKTKEQRASDLRKALQNLLDNRAGEGESTGVKLSTMTIRDIEKKCGTCKLCVLCPRI